MTATWELAGAAGVLGDHPRPDTLYGIGAGPGDPGLLTVRAATLLGRLDLVCVPRSARGSGIARHAVAPYVDPARLVELVSDMPDGQAAVRAGWSGRVLPVLDALEAGRTVGFVTDGDPALFSTFAYVAEAVTAARPATAVVVIPGIPAMCAAAAAAGEPLTVGAERLTVLPASRVDDGELLDALRRSDTVVLLKVGAALDRVRRLLEGPARGWTVRYARRVGLPGEEHAQTLDGLGDPGDYMALAVLRRPRDPNPVPIHPGDTP